MNDQPTRVLDIAVVEGNAVEKLHDFNPATLFTLQEDQEILR